MGHQADDVWGLALIVVALLVGLAFFDLAGPVGTWLTMGLAFLFGIWAYFIPFCLIVIGLALVGSLPRKDYGRISIAVLALFMSSLALFHLLTGTISLAESLEDVMARGGVVGSLMSFPLRRLIGFWGALTVLVAVIGLGALIMTRASLRDVARTIWSAVRGAVAFLRSFQDVREVHVDPPMAGDVEVTRPRRSTGPAGPEPAATRPKQQKRPAIKPPTTGDYVLPPLELLNLSDRHAHNRKALEQMAIELEESLHQHGVDARLTRIVPGPTVTRYEIELAPGVKVSRVTGLSHDIAYALASPDVRILAPIPGKSAIGIEVPNRRRDLVTLGDILTSGEAAADLDPMSVALGKDISGTSRLLTLTDLPHVLIAGATGAGKSSCINAIVTSLLMRATPDEVRLVLVDPKRVELGQYNGVPHLMTRVITNPKKAADALQWAVQEMDRRYELLADAGVRDITSYREKYDAGGVDEEMFDRFPYIVVIVDELNDLMMVAGRAVEDSIVRIAQMARAVGIHLVLATQRPSVNVITGVIKANIPSRLAFSVTSQTDSRVILDSSGAEKLVGLGDMLVATAREPKPERIQGAFVSEAEVHAVVEWVKQQQNTRYEEKQVFEVAERRAAVEEEFEGEDPDIIREAIELIVRSQLGSTSMLQRKLRIGFARAGRVMDILENKGIVGPSEGSKAREVLITADELHDVLTSA
ncbi:MAG TPA: DNA translocase FtsK 4TM domain-containing protein [Acidimicrobiia bacterium]|jgi:S-DNA-T family DNA segregation ATPase FtsK/SpoIIIE